MEVLEVNLQHEDLLIKLRGKLNDEKIKLWEPPYTRAEDGIAPSLQELARKYASELSMEYDTIIEALLELQLHSLDRSKANAEFKVTGCATFRVRVTVPGERPRVIKVQKKLDVMGSELVAAVAADIGFAETRVKLIFNGKVIKPTTSLEDQGITNGAQIMALIVAENPEQLRLEESRYRAMQATRDDAALLSECVDDLGADEDYMKLEDQSGRAVELPAATRRALMVALALHERGRGAARAGDHSLALLLFLEADRHFMSCGAEAGGAGGAAAGARVDNWAVLQLDVAWSYLRLRGLGVARDAAPRLAAAARALDASYGARRERLHALKGPAASERVLFMRLYLLQGIVAYHQNQRDEARRLLGLAEAELNALRVDEGAVSALVELGWSRAQARVALRAAGGADAAHHWLLQRHQTQEQARQDHRRDRMRRLLGACADGSALSAALVAALQAMGYSRKLAVLALRNSNNNVAEACRLIQEQPDLLVDSDMSSDEEAAADEAGAEPDAALLAHPLSRPTRPTRQIRPPARPLRPRGSPRYKRRRKRGRASRRWAGCRRASRPRRTTTSTPRSSTRRSSSRSTSPCSKLLTLSTCCSRALTLSSPCSKSLTLP